MALSGDEGQRQNVKPDLLAACIVKQDPASINASRKEAEALGVDSTPALFINGERVGGSHSYRIHLPNDRPGADGCGTGTAPAGCFAAHAGSRETGKLSFVFLPYSWSLSLRKV